MRRRWWRRARGVDLGDNRAMQTDAGLTPGRELAGNVVLITGGGRNIGRAIALSLAAGGAGVMVNVDRSRTDVAGPSAWSRVARRQASSRT
jgi:hypothetical protein